MTDLSRDIGKLEGRQESTEARLDRIETKIDSLGDKVDRLNRSDSYGRGAIAVLVTIAGMIGAGLVEGARALFGK